MAGNFFVILIEWILLAFLIYRTFECIKESGSLSKNTPKEKVEICTSLPYEGATPGQIAFFRSNEFLKTGDVFAGSLINLSYKKALKFVYKGNEYNFKNTFIEVETENVPKLLAEEVPVYNFLKECIDRFGGTSKTISLYMLQKIISNDSSRVVKLKKDMFSSIKSSLIYYNSDSLTKIKKSLIGIIIYLLIIFTIIFIHGGKIDIFTLHSWVEILSIVNLIHKARVICKTNMFDQQGTEYQEKVKGFEKYLLSFDSRDIPDISIWNYYISHVVALGLSSKVFPKLKSCYLNILDSDFTEMYRNSTNILKCEFEKIFALTYVV